MAFDLSLVGRTFAEHRTTYSTKDAALYALACGATEDELDLLLDSRGPKVLPTFSVVFAFPAIADAIAQLGGNILMLVHGEQRCALPQPLPAEAEVTTTATLTAVYDKGKGALAVFATDSRDHRGRELARTEWQIFYRGEGGFGGERGPEASVAAPGPDEAPAAVIAMPTARTSALLYRWVSGDPNPIHIEPTVAEQVGFERPILHGLCTFGHAARAVARVLADGDTDRIRALQGRFTKPVFPGSVLETRVWPRGEGRGLFVTEADGVEAIARGQVELF